MKSSQNYYVLSSEESNSHDSNDSDTDFDPNDENNDNEQSRNILTSAEHITYKKLNLQDQLNICVDSNTGDKEHELDWSSYMWVHELKAFDINPGKTLMALFSIQDYVDHVAIHL